MFQRVPVFTEAEIETLKVVYPQATCRDDILKHFPSRSWDSIRQKAHGLRLRVGYGRFPIGWVSPNRKERVIKRCAFCSKEFHVIPGLARQKYCSRTCAMKLKFRDDLFYKEVGKIRPAKGERRSPRTEFTIGQPPTTGSFKKGEHRSPNTEFKKGQSPISPFKKGSVPWNKGKELPPQKQCPSAEELKSLYTDKQLSVTEIRHLYSASFRLVAKWLRQLGIPIRNCKERAKLALNKPETKAKCRESHIKALKETPDYLRHIMSSRRPTDIEQRLIEIIGKHGLPYKYTGDGSFVIGGKNPDFVNTNSEKVAIDIFGDFWHKPDEVEERKSIFADYGWTLHILWGSEIKQLPEAKIVEKIDVVR